MWTFHELLKRKQINERPFSPPSWKHARHYWGLEADSCVAWIRPLNCGNLCRTAFIGSICDRRSFDEVRLLFGCAVTEHRPRLFPAAVNFYFSLAHSSEHNFSTLYDQPCAFHLLQRCFPPSFRFLSFHFSLALLILPYFLSLFRSLLSFSQSFLSSFVYFRHFFSFSFRCVFLPLYNVLVLIVSYISFLSFCDLTIFVHSLSFVHYYLLIWLPYCISY